jgi:16S rRNA (guanine527-N7)-methyltransferase
MSEILNSLSPETRKRLHELLDEVLRVNQQFNLTAVRDPQEAWHKHIIDSLQGLETSLFEGSKGVIDVGTGPGFPGLPLAMARPELKVTFLDSTRKKIDFIRATGEKFGLNIKVLNERAEEVGQNAVWRERYAIATARAVGSLSEVCELCLPLVKVGGHLVLWRGEKADEEVKTSRGAMHNLGGKFQTLLPYHLPENERKYHIVVIEKTKHTPSIYPRRTGIPKQNPL